MAPPTIADDEQALPSLLRDAERLYDIGCSALRSDSYDEAAECFSKSLEIRVQHFGELAPECAATYYKFGCALLYKVQAESEALVVKEDRADGEESKEKEEEDEEEEDEQDDDEENQVPGEGGENGRADRDGSAEKQEAGDAENAGGEEEGDLLLAWKMLDIARIIYSKGPERTLAEVDVITTLADVSLEREVQMCFEDYEEALRMLETLVEADNRRIAELCFKISIAKQLDQKPKEALEYCERAVSVCERRVERLNKELAEIKVHQRDSNGHTTDGGGEAGCKESVVEEPLKSKSSKQDSNSPSEAEVKEMEELLVDLRQKVEELQEMAVAPTLYDVLKASNPEAATMIKQAYSMSVELATKAENGGLASISQAGTSSSAIPVTNLGVVGRGVKRAVPTPITEEQLSPPDTQSRKRTTEDLLSGGNAAGSQVAFGGSS